MIGAGAVLLLVAAALQQPVVSASVDRTDVMVGDIVTLTIRVEAEGAAPVRITNPTLRGLEVRGSRDVTRVALEDGVARRTVVREIRLAAVTPGTASIGPTRVERDGAVAETVTITVTVGNPGAAASVPMSPRLQAVLDTLRPPVAGEGVMVEVVPIPGRVMLGDQLDLITLAWFPREVRTQLRTPPTLAPPDVQGVWSYQQTTAAGVVASRRVGGRWFDLYVSHQVVFPLSTGAVAVGRATVSYVQPLSYSFLSRELQHEVQSESVFVQVLPQPTAGRPTSFSGAAGADLTVALTASDALLPAGGAATVSVDVAGVGNVALWPEPDVSWPAGLRVYPAGVTIESDLADGRIAGTKRFTYLVIADSAGAHLVPGVSYPFFDTGRQRYAAASAPGLRLIAPPGTVGAPTRPLPAPPQPRPPPTLVERIEGLAPWIWGGVLALPPLILLAVAVGRRIRWRRPRVQHRAVERESRALAELDRELREALTRRIGTGAHEEGASLTSALRAAGVEASLAQHVARVRERLHHAVFGPPASGDADELAAEVHEILRALAGESPGAERRELVPTALLLVLLCGAGTATAQAPRPEDLYAAQAFRAAADSFQARVTREPRVAMYWYDLGASFYRLGEDGRARVAWIRAARLAPRDPNVRQALALLPADPLSAEIVPTPPWRPAEAWVVGGVLWLIGWGLIAFRRIRRVGMAVLALALAAGVVGWRLERRYRAPAAIVLQDNVPLRAAPYGSADAGRHLSAGDAVRVRRRRGSFLLVDRGGTDGWVLVGEVARL